MDSQTHSPLKIIFAGTPEFAQQHLAALLSASYDVIAVYTQPDRPAGRGKKLTPSPVKQLAVAQDIPVLQPVSLKTADAQAELSALNADLMVVVAYGLLLPQAVLDTPRLGCINVHGSILPRWRGAAPIQRAIEAGDTETGITIMQMDIGLDTGDMMLKKFCAIEPTDTSSILHDKLIDVGQAALLEVLPQIAVGTAQREAQDNRQANYAHKISKAEATIDWRESAPCIHRRICAFNPFPVANTDIDNGDKPLRLRIHQAQAVNSDVRGTAGQIVAATKAGVVVQCGEGQVCLTHLQLPGKKVMDAPAFFNGYEALVKVGTSFRWPSD